MHTTPISSKCFVLFLLLSLLAIIQVSSRKCYTCESSVDEPCFNNVNHANFQYDCEEAITHYSRNINDSSEHLQLLIKEYSADYQPGIAYEFNCVTITGVAISNFGEERIVRGCIPKSKNCSDFQTYSISSGFLTESCESCDANLCNSQPRTKVPRLPKISIETESYTEAITTATENYIKTTTVKTQRLSSSLQNENTESDAKTTTAVAKAKRLSSLAEVMKFDYRICFWCATVLLCLTFF